MLTVVVVAVWYGVVISYVFPSKTDFSSYLSICLWYLHVFSMQWYFLIFSYYLTVSNGYSLTALKSEEFTLSSGSFKWGRGDHHQFSLYLPIS